MVNWLSGFGGFHLLYISKVGLADHYVASVLEEQPTRYLSVFIPRRLAAT